MEALLVANDNLLTVDYLRDVRDADGTYITTGTVTAQVKTRAGANVGSLVTLTFVSASTTGTWQGVIEDDVAIVAGTPYVVVVDIAASGDRIGHVELETFAATRRR